MKRQFCLYLALMCLGPILVFSTSAFSQAVYGSIFGTVTDPQGAAVAGAKVSVTSATKGTTAQTTTNDSGNYSVTHLIPDVYNIRVESSGFKAFEATNIQVSADTAARVDGQFQVGGASETVEVTAEAPQLKTDRADVATIFDERAVSQLPVYNRNFTQLELFTPGTNRLMWQHASAENPQGSTQIMVDGQHFSGTSYQLDGTENRDPILGIIVVNPALDWVSETKMTTQNFDAEFGQAVAGVMTAQTKSGSNDFHGSASLFRRTDWGQARNPFSEPEVDSSGNRIRRPIAPSKWLNFDGVVGGPIIKNKLFFFGGYQGTRRTVGNSVLLNVPTALVRSTCLDPTSAVCDLSEYPNQIYDPTTGASDGSGRTAFGPLGTCTNNCIPETRIDPRAIALLSLLPAPNAGTGNSNNFTTNGSGSFNEDDFTVRIDHQTTDKLKILGRYSYANFKQVGPAAFGTAGGRGLGIEGFAGTSKARNQSVTTGFDYVVSPSLLTDFRFGFFRYHVNVTPNGFGTQPMNNLSVPGGGTTSIPGLNLDNNFTSGFPFFDVQGTGGFKFGTALDDNGGRCNCPLLENEQQFQFVNNWTKMVGNHQFKFGADLRYARNLRVASDAHRAGQLSFNNSITGLGGAGGGGGLGLGTLLLGYSSQVERYTGTLIDAGERQKRFFFYGQDTYRLSPRLTLNYGLRWEIYFPQTVTGPGRGGFLDINTGLVRVAGVGPIDSAMNVENSFTNFAPRVGIAYQFNDKTVIRMGYGRSFDIGVFGSIFGHSVTQNLPVLVRQQVQGPSGNTFQPAFTLAAGPPAFPFPTADPTTGTFPLPNGAVTFVQTPRMQLPTLDAWNLSVQRQIAPSLSGEIAYVGNKGTHTFAGNGPDYNCNQATIVGFPTVPNLNRRPFGPIFGWGQDLRCHLNNADNNYNSLQTKLDKRFTKGYQLLAHYTWAKGLNHDGDYFDIDKKLNYGLDDFNHKHVFVLTNIVELPFGRGKTFLGDSSGVMDRIVGGWQIAAVTTWMSGLPFSPSYQACGSDRDTGPCRPNLVGSVSTGLTRNQWFTVSPTIGLANGQTAGPWQRPQVATFGTAGRNSLIGPRFFDTDFGVTKKIPITEKLNVQFRADAFNVFNHVNLANPNACVDCNASTDGQITAIAPGSLMRQFQFALRVEF